MSGVREVQVPAAVAGGFEACVDATGDVSRVEGVRDEVEAAQDVAGGSCRSQARARSMLRSWLIVTAACASWPITSPMIRALASSGRGKPSYQSPLPAPLPQCGIDAFGVHSVVPLALAEGTAAGDGLRQSGRSALLRAAVGGYCLRTLSSLVVRPVCSCLFGGIGALQQAPGAPAPGRLRRTNAGPGEIWAECMAQHPPGRCAIRRRALRR